MSRFSGGGSKLPVVEEDEKVTVPTKAILTLTTYVVGTQKTIGSTVLVTSSHAVDENTEVLQGRDGDSGIEVEITVHVKP